MGERYVPPEARDAARTIEGKEKEKFQADLAEYITGLETALQDPDLTEEDRAELEEQLAGLRDSQEAIEDGGPVKVNGA
jgi:hypothetical protein